MADRVKTTYLKDSMNEFIKYDINHIKYPLVLLARIYIYALRKLSKHNKAFDIASQVFRNDWAGSDKLGFDAANFYFNIHSEVGKTVVNRSLEFIEPTLGTAKFLSHPLLMLGGGIVFLKKTAQKGQYIIIIIYSCYFSLLLKFFDVSRITTKFHMILKPSWDGLCELNILAYTQYDFPVLFKFTNIEIRHSLNRSK